MPSKIGRPTTESFWLRAIHNWERSGKSQPEYCQANGLKLTTFKKNLQRIRKKAGTVTRPEMRNVSHPDKSVSHIVSLTSGKTLLISEKDAYELIGLFHHYYRLPPSATKEELFQEKEAAAKRWRDFEMRKYH